MSNEIWTHSSWSRLCDLFNLLWSLRIKSSLSSLKITDFFVIDVKRLLLANCTLSWIFGERLLAVFGLTSCFTSSTIVCSWNLSVPKNNCLILIFSSFDSSIDISTTPSLALWSVNTLDAFDASYWSSISLILFPSALFVLCSSSFSSSLGVDQAPAHRLRSWWKKLTWQGLTTK